jgi:hypothetical protein
MPSNAEIFFSIIIGVTTFNVLPTDLIFEFFLRFDDNNNVPLNDYFDFMDIF